MLVDNFMVGAGFVLPADEQERKGALTQELFAAVSKTNCTRFRLIRFIKEG
jgi:hypothetical protein